MIVTKFHTMENGNVFADGFVANEELVGILVCTGFYSAGSNWFSEDQTDGQDSLGECSKSGMFIDCLGGGDDCVDGYSFAKENIAQKTDLVLGYCLRMGVKIYNKDLFLAYLMSL